MLKIPAPQLAAILKQFQEDGFTDTSANDHTRRTVKIVRLATEDLTAHEDFSTKDFELIRCLSMASHKCTQQRKIALVRDSRLRTRTKTAILEILEGNPEENDGCWGTGKMEMSLGKRALRKVREIFLLLLSDAPKSKIDDYINQELKDVEGVGIATLSTLFYCLRPQEYAVLNGGMKQGLSQFFGRAIHVDLSHYVEENDLLLAFRDKNGLSKDLRSVDHLFCFKRYLGYLQGDDALLNLVNSFAEKYTELRTPEGAESEHWNEGYKWEILPSLGKNVFADPITSRNVVKKIQELSRSNPPQGSFVHWSNLQNLRELATEHPKEISEILKNLLESREHIGKAIDAALETMRQLKPKVQLGTPLWGYFLAAADCSQFPLYKDETFLALRDALGKREEWKSLSIGEKYEMFRTYCLKIGDILWEREILDEFTAKGIPIDPGYTALDGQDFLYMWAGLGMPAAPTTQSNDTSSQPSGMDALPLNMILYGPPGTGKTYETIQRSLAIVHNDPSYGKDKSDEELSREWRALCESRQITFITFHQSYSYEDFVEGIRPDIKDGQVIYKREDGIFKELAQFANSGRSRSSGSSTDLSKANFFKMSLGDTMNSADDNIYDYCLSHNVVALGYGGETDYKDCDTLQSIRERYVKTKGDADGPYPPTAVHYLKNEAKTGDIVLISEGNRKIRAIGRFTGAYRYDPNVDIPYHHLRSVEWLLTDVQIPIESISTKKLSQMSVYGFDKKDLKIEAIQALVSGKAASGKEKNYVLIIDEINRGNISRIFGELIALIEKDKRIGAAHELRATLPISRESFGVPQNLYILGTMNTADRSIAFVDAALRRRFVFEPVYPRPELIEDDYLRNFLTKLNENIAAKLDDDHMIGHAHFMGKTKEDLGDIIQHCILPLLHEYFFDRTETMKEMFEGTGVQQFLVQAKLGSRLLYDDHAAAA